MESTLTPALFRAPTKNTNPPRVRLGFAALALLLVLCGCAGSSSRKASFTRPFAFGEDTFAYRNDLVWVYYRVPEYHA